VEAAGSNDPQDRRWIKKANVYTINIDTPYSMEQSPSLETNRFEAIQEFRRILWNPKVHHRIHNFPPPVYPDPAQFSVYIPLPEDQSYPPIYA
jgi:hypothetical protein